MIHSLVKRKLLTSRKILAYLSIALLTLLGLQLRPLTPIRDLALALAYSTIAFFFIKRKILGVRVVFALCGVGFALVLGILTETLKKTFGWQGSFVAISVAYGFAALLVTGGFLKEFAWITAGLKVNNRSRVTALFLTSSIAFLINAIIMSAGSTCAVVAPIFVPLLIRLGFPAPVAAAAVVLGAWGGFVNPFDAGGVAITDAYQQSSLTMYSIPGKHIGPALLALIVANITFAAMTWKNNQSTDSVTAFEEEEHIHNRGRRSLIVILPFLVYFPVEVLGQRLGWWHDKGDSRLGICLVVASMVAFVVVLRNSKQGRKRVLPVGREFLGGMWKGFVDVVLLIIAAKLFIAPFLEILVNNSKQAMTAVPILAIVSVPTAFLGSAALGSGDALVTSLAPFVVGMVQSSTVLTNIIVSMLWLATEMGRNVSPISAATITCAKTITPTEIEGAAISRHLLCPVLAGFVIGCLALYLAFN
jgi:C4-dicarboxylate transporter